MKKRLIFSVLFVLFTFIIAIIGIAQTRDELKQKYGSPDAKGRYIVRPGIGLSVKYKQNQNPSEINILPLALDIEDTSKSSDEVMPSDKAVEVLDELVPVSKRGAKVTAVTYSSGCPITISTEYERVIISINNRCQRRGGGTYSISIQWKK